MANSVKTTYSKYDAERLLSEIHTQIQHADNKASILLAFIAIIVGFSYNIFSSLNRLDFTNKRALSISIIVFLIFYIIILSIALIFEILVLTARYKSNKIIKNDNDKFLLSFGQIAQTDINQFCKLTEKLSEDIILNELNAQIVINSKIVKKKYNYFNLALYFSIGVFVFAIISTTLSVLI